ncbi:hypothetical protein O0L34_g4553 [Tuta absoluta]|nr:hypothetical protein O0L34_g4553 [Tuta absoluta]
MWKPLKNTDHFLSFLSQDLEVCVTDYVSIWRVQFTEESFKNCLKESNYGLDINESVLEQKGKFMLSNPEDLKKPVQLKVDGKSLDVTLATSFGFPVRLELKLTESSKELFFNKITQPLLKTVQNLHASQRELRDSLQKKDLEIEEYKCDGGEIALKFLKTIPFSDEGHMSKYSVYNEQFGQADVPNCLMNKSVVVPELQVVKTESSVSNVKQEQAEPNNTTYTTETPTPSGKSESTEIKTEASIKTEAEAEIKEEVKSEAMQTRSPSRLLTRPGVVGPSPSKRNRKKLNL